ncbi:hypothetical protein CRI94_14285 [Longibacter salinarum]|uniref:Zinc-finger domain-containing protein n=1 Tax=Longibacter salinarum TaxID=1850348 RepID=A0A2A8CWA3_9BACT|nr:hypothetical protein [Longibacter salinarum]PEN12678.1 hypothetical protein CRI94_14285 [Longibacter salinarum]
MNASDPNMDTRLLCYLTGDLSAEETDRLETRLANDPELRARLDRLRALKHTMQSPQRRFDSGFAGRVMDRLREADPVPAFDRALQTIFLRLAVVVLLMIGGIGSYNVATNDDASASAVEAALGLPDVTLTAAAHDTLVPADE